MLVTQYRPSFFEGFENEVNELDTVAEILKLDYIKKWSMHNDFHQFSASPHGEKDGIKIYTLIAEFNEGRVWWVVAYIESTTVPDLPTWIPNEDENGQR